MLQTAIKETRMLEEEQKALQKIEIHNLTDLLLEQDIRSHLEDKYVRKLGTSPAHISLVGARGHHITVRASNIIVMLAKG